MDRILVGHHRSVSSLGGPDLPGIHLTLRLMEACFVFGELLLHDDERFFVVFVCCELFQVRQPRQEVLALLIPLGQVIPLSLSISQVQEVVLFETA